MAKCISSLLHFFLAFPLSPPSSFTSLCLLLTPLSSSLLSPSPLLPSPPPSLLPHPSSPLPPLLCRHSQVDARTEFGDAVRRHLQTTPHTVMTVDSQLPSQVDSVNDQHKNTATLVTPFRANRLVEPRNVGLFGAPWALCYPHLGKAKLMT